MGFYAISSLERVKSVNHVRVYKKKKIAKFRVLYRPVNLLKIESFFNYDLFYIFYKFKDDIFQNMSSLLIDQNHPFKEHIVISFDSLVMNGSLLQ